MKEIKNLKLKESKATHLFLVLVAFLLVFILFNSIHVSADAPKAKLTDDQRGEISMSCSSINLVSKSSRLVMPKSALYLGLITKQFSILTSLPSTFALSKITRTSATFPTCKVISSCRKTILIRSILPIANNLKISSLLTVKKIPMISIIS